MQSSAPAAAVTPVIHRVSELDLKLARRPWPFAEARRAEIDAHFARAQRDKPKLWNGRILLGRNPAFSAGRFRADYFETDFASFLAWRDWAFPDTEVFNGFGAGALRGSDGVFVLGEMADHTANGGRIYFPSGTPDLDDIDGDSVDIPGSVAREVGEETGLTPSDYRAAGHWDCVVTGRLVAMVRVLEVGISGSALREKIEANLAGQSSPELSAIHLVRTAADLTPAMPLHVTAYLQAQLARADPREC